MTNPASYQLNDGIATITLDDGKANVMSPRMLQAINDALTQAEADQAVVVITGRPGMFSGGFDLAVFKGDPKDQLSMLNAGAQITHRLLSFPHPVIAACSGHAVAMGVFLLLSTDVRIGLDQGAMVHVNEVQIGMTVPHFALEVCRQRLTPANLNLATVTAQPYSTVQALAAGFFDEIVPAEALAAAALAQATRLKKLNRAAFTATKLRQRQAGLATLAMAIEQDGKEWAARIGK
jgi:enoyl-CoA hydratase